MKKKSMMVILMGLMMFTSCNLSAANESQGTSVTVVAETKATETPTDTEKNANATTNVSEVSGTRNMTEEELQTMSEWVSRPENSGFFLSSYNNPKYADYDMVYYDGAGIKCDDYSEEELMDDYYSIVDATEEEEEFGRELDIIGIKKQDIVNHLQNKVGLSLEDIGFDWVYSPNYDMYYAIHSDCYAAGYQCLEGTVTINEKGEEIYTIKLNDYEASLITLKKTNDGYQIISCVHTAE